MSASTFKKSSDPMNFFRAISFMASGKALVSEIMPRIKGVVPHKDLRQALDNLRLKMDVGNPPTPSEILEADEIWAARAEQLLGHKFPKRGMAFYFLIYLDGLSLLGELSEVTSGMEDMRAKQALVLGPLEAMAKRFGVKVDELPFMLMGLDTDFAAELIEMMPLIKTMQRITEEASHHLKVLETMIPALFGYLKYIEGPVTPQKGKFFKGAFIWLWKQAGGASLKDFQEAARLAEEFYRNSGSNLRIASVARPR